MDQNRTLTLHRERRPKRPAWDEPGYAKGDKWKLNAGAT